jgi:hypothetical protein
MQLPCRNWLRDIAMDYALVAGLTGAAAGESVAATVREAQELLPLMPWHTRFAVGCVEIAASLFCYGDNLVHGGQADPARTMRSFAMVPVISSPLFRLYRSVVAASFFEQPAVLAALGIENPELRQDRFRAIRDKAA